MSRYANPTSAGTAAVAASMLTSIAAKEQNYKESIIRNHALTKSIASRLKKDERGSIEDVLTQTIASSSSERNVDAPRPSGDTTQESSNSSATVLDNDKLQQFLHEQRERIKKIARINVENERNAVIFCKSILALKRHIETNAMETSSSTVNDNDEEIPDYQELVGNIMDKERKEMEKTQILVEHEPMYREVCESMGEPVIQPMPKSKKKNNRKSKAIVDDDDDDDLVVMNNSTSATSLKCPITGTTMEDPVRNKLCRHEYSREGIMQHIRQMSSNRSCSGVSCPVPGCMNRNVTEEQLEKDVDLEIRIRQERRRQALQAQREANNANDVDEDDDDDDDDEGEEQY